MIGSRLLRFLVPIEARRGLMGTTSRALALVIAGALATGCATTEQQQPRLDAGVFPRTTVTAAELSRTGTQDLMSALRAVRPWFLTGRGSSPFVVIDGSPAMELSVLGGLRVSEIAEVKYLQSASAVGFSAITLTGRTVVGSVLVVRTLRGR